MSGDVNKLIFIYHEDIQNPSNGTAYFGPFSSSEIIERCNDAYADLLAGSGNVDSITFTQKEAEKIGYINPREYWMEQLAKCQSDDDPGLAVKTRY